MPHDNQPAERHYSWRLGVLGAQSALHYGRGQSRPALSKLEANIAFVRLSEPMDHALFQSRPYALEQLASIAFCDHREQRKPRCSGRVMANVSCASQERTVAAMH